MNARTLPRLALLAGAILLAGACAAPSTRTGADAAAAIEAELPASLHRDGDDLLTAGLGADGLRAMTPPAFANPDAPSAEELRRRAIWSNWRGIADLAPDGGYGERYGSLQPVPGREFHALMRLPGAKQPHRVLLQLPDDYDPKQRCLVVAVSSGSRGIYGAIALAGAWGLPRGCAVAYTDKGAGTGYVDTADGRGIGLDGRVGEDGQRVEFAVTAAPEGAPPAIAVKHAHSGDNPEADWGRHAQQAAQFALQVLNRERPQDGAYTWDNTRVLLTGLSNGGGAVLRAAELPGPEFDAVVAVSPNVWPAEGGRALFDYASEAAIWMPCALAAPDFDAVVLARPGGQPAPAALQRCASLRTSGELRSDTPRGQAAEALAFLRAQGWTDKALAAGALSTAFDLWRSVLVTYASAYAGTGPFDMPCGYRLAAMGADGVARAPTAAERAAWWSDANGIPPGAGVGIVDTMAAGEDPHLPGLRCLRALGEDEGSAVRAGIAATRAGLPRDGLPVIVLHGSDDGLIPEAFSARPYVAGARAAGREVEYRPVADAQHFDAFLGLPFLRPVYVPMLEPAYQALDDAWSRITAGTPE